MIACYGGKCYRLVCVSVCVSVTSRSSVVPTAKIELLFGTEACFHLTHTVLQGNSGISEIPKMWALLCGILSSTLALGIFGIAFGSQFIILHATFYSTSTTLFYLYHVITLFILCDFTLLMLLLSTQEKVCRPRVTQFD